MGPLTKKRLQEAFSEGDALNEVMESVSTLIFRQWQNAEDEITREELHAEYRALHKLKRVIHAAATEHQREPA